MDKFIPTSCVWETTLRCNLACLHCGSGAGKPRGAELGTDEAFALIDDLKDLGCRRIILGGGEPLLREDFAALVRRIADRGMRPCLISNGMLLPDRIELLKGLPLQSVGVSLDGMEETHNHLRRDRRSFGRVLESVRLLTGLFVDVYVISQINRLNLDETEEMHRLIAGLGVDGWQIQLTSDMGRAEDMKGSMLGRPQVLRLLEFIVGKEHGPVRIFAADDLGYYRRGRFRFGGCRGGISNIGIEADGGVKPCLSMQKDNRFLGGNIRQRSLREIWEDPGFASVNRKARKLEGACADCGHRWYCRGGCVGTAMAFDSLKEYPFCVKGAERPSPRRPRPGNGW